MSDFHERLRRLGVVKGARQLRPAPPVARPSAASPLEALLPGGRIEPHPTGGCFVLDHTYPLGHGHGRTPLSALLDYDPSHAIPFLHGGPLPPSFRDFLFIDTETTGLAGAGTMAFMVGVAFFEGNALLVRQYFLRGPADEPALLGHLSELAEGKQGLISFNGRSFDLPLLDNRYLLTRQPPPLANWLNLPHLDLLHPARRVWRGRLPSCSLGSLEQQLLDVHRTHEDVPGWFIPTLYANYLRGGDAEPIARIFYHNQYDLLSMVTLAVRLLRQITTPQPDDHPLDLCGVGRWQADLGLAETAEQTLRLALRQAPTSAVALGQLAALLKRQGRRAEAVALWEQWAAVSHDPTAEPHLELAKYYEWHALDLPRAHEWTKRAQHYLQTFAPYQRPLLQELEHRLGRLVRKMGGGRM
jgi:uncharacterized protein